VTSFTEDDDFGPPAEPPNLLLWRNVVNRGTHLLTIVRTGF